MNERRDQAISKPLVVDLDGTLVPSDLLIETTFAELGRRPTAIFDIVALLFKGKAALKHHFGRLEAFDPAILPYDPVILDRIQAARKAGRKVYLASASTERLVAMIAEHLNMFDGWFASSNASNLSGRAKAELLVATFGEGGFDYIGNDKADLHVWSKADQALTIRSSKSVMRRLSASHSNIHELEHEKPTVKTWLKLFRVHQYTKNILVFVPLVTSHSFSAMALGTAILAFLAYCLCASAVYVLNDLVDLAADREHQTKRRRPLASGAIPLLQAILCIPLLLIAGLATALAVSPSFLAMVLGYLALTTAYSFYLKRKMIVDVIALAMLYTARVLGGAVAIEVVVSHWLMAFSMFIFTALALMKRYIELSMRLDAALPEPSNRNYRKGDLVVVMALAAAAGFNAVTVLALYISSSEVGRLYSHPEILWLACPMLMYWIGRALVMSHRRLIDDDPVVFAVRDRNSRFVMAALALIAVAAT